MNRRFVQVSLVPGDYTARLLKIAHKGATVPLYNEYELLLPDRTTLALLCHRDLRVATTTSAILVRLNEAGSVPTGLLVLVHPDPTLPPQADRFLGPR